MVAGRRERANVERWRHLGALLAVLEPLQHILRYFGLVLAAQDDVHTGNLGDFLALELRVTTGYHHQGVGVLADEVADVLAAFAVGQRGHAAGVHHAHIGYLTLADGHNAMPGKR